PAETVETRRFKTDPEGPLTLSCRSMKAVRDGIVVQLADRPRTEAWRGEPHLLRRRRRDWREQDPRRGPRRPDLARHGRAVRPRRAVLCRVPPTARPVRPSGLLRAGSDTPDSGPLLVRSARPDRHGLGTARLFVHFHYSRPLRPHPATAVRRSEHPGPSWGGREDDPRVARHDGANAVSETRHARLPDVPLRPGEDGRRPRGRADPR